MNKCRKIACLFGSFNPIHNGHIHIAEKVIELADIDEVWFLISPHNPFKNNSDLEDETHRLNMVELSIVDYNKFKVCDIEMKMDRPSFTYKTLRKLTELYPNNEFSLISGSDTINQMDTWTNSHEIFEYNLITFIRSNEEVDFTIPQDKLTILKSDFNLSSTILRDKIKNNYDITGLTAQKTIDYINKYNLFN